MSLDGLTIVLDCAHGAAYRVAPLVFQELGARVISLGVEPDGLNINAGCGSLHPECVRSKVLETGADLGIALDGDADRVILVDEQGNILDGDQVMALCAQDFLDKDILTGRTLVATVMSNMALELFMRERGGQLLRTPVGDRYVAEAMRAHGAVLGGEQSGHLIFLQYSTTGDGVLAALQVLKVMQEKQRPVSDLAGILDPMPQYLMNVPVQRKIPFDQVLQVQKSVHAAEKALKGNGRVLLRYSGTETKARVMVEGMDPELVQTLTADLAQVIQDHVR
jgi:phosphoglucosamine mutase